MMFNSSDIKNENNALYEVKHRRRDGSAQWYVVRDLGTALGETGRLAPQRGDPDIFEREPFITGVTGRRRPVQLSRLASGAAEAHFA